MITWSDNEVYCYTKVSSEDLDKEFFETNPNGDPVESLRVISDSLGSDSSAFLHRGAIAPVHIVSAAGIS